MPPLRTRFCPAPSGSIHVGNARTALYNWLWARGQGGAFVLRIEDTDAERVTQAGIDGVLDALRFLGLDWDEGPQSGGAHGPYIQSERAALYTSVGVRLLAARAAYEAYETPEELAAQREEAQRAGRPPGYAGGHRDLTDAQQAAFRAEGRVPVIRVRTPDDGTVSFTDAVRGRVEFAWRDVADLVVLRADGSVTYPLANAVDDLAMGITFVARGEDLLSATPRQLQLYDLLLRGGLLDAALAEVGLPARPEGAEPPRFAHLPLMVGADRKPLSKRQGSVAVDELRRQGFLPEVLVNFLALCGWSYDGVTERFTVPQLVEHFSFERVSHNPAFFDTDKLRAMNGDVIKDLRPDELAERLVPFFVEAGLVPTEPSAAQLGLIARLAPLLQERVQTLAEAPPLVAFCFADALTYDGAAVAKHLKGRAGEVLDEALQSLDALREWTAESIMAALDGVSERLGIGRGKTFQPVRVAVAGSAVSPPLPETLALLDRDLVLERIRGAIQLVHG